VHYILIHCPHYNRSNLIQAVQTESLYTILSQPKRAQHTAKWFIKQNILKQFETAKTIGEEDTSGYAPIQDLENWGY